MSLLKSNCFNVSADKASLDIVLILFSVFSLSVDSPIALFVLASVTFPEP